MPASLPNPIDPSEPPVVSAIIPSYNSASVLSDALNSVINQTRPADEIIVVDDGSSDNTAALCQSYADRLQVIRQDNCGASYARNTGIAAAKGNWIAFLDADDLWEPEKLETQLLAVSQNPQADFVITAVRAWSPSRRQYQLYRWEGSLNPTDLRAQLLVRNIFTGLCSSLLIRRRALDAVGGFAASKACEDRRIALDLLEDHRALILSQPLVRQRPGPAHWTDPMRHRREMLQLIEDYDSLYKRLDPSGRLRRRARARVHERTGMHYLENGNLSTAGRYLVRAALCDPWMPNPWRVLVNACLGRLSLKEKRANQGASM